MDPRLPGTKEFFSLLCYQEEIREKAPEEDWLSFKVATQGIVLFRNEFNNEKDIFAVFNTSFNWF